MTRGGVEPPAGLWLLRLSAPDAAWGVADVDVILLVEVGAGAGQRTAGQHTGSVLQLHHTHRGFLIVFSFHIIVLHLFNHYFFTIINIYACARGLGGEAAAVEGEPGIRAINHEP